jgi:SARP family transcriptional regulator, regulator of embCAB operon
LGSSTGPISGHAGTATGSPPQYIIRRVRVELLGRFGLFERDREVAVPVGSQRLLAFAALRGRPDRRIVVAASLWPEVSERRSYASLRSALARLDHVGRDALRVDPVELSLAVGVGVDLRDTQALAQRLLNPARPPLDADLTSSSVTRLSADLLPGWYDEWVLLAAEDWRQLRMHALEALSKALTRWRRFGAAIAAARAAVGIEPLRESAQAALIRVHLAEGNQSEALRDFDRYGQLLHAELGLRPTRQLHDLVAGLRDGVTRR